MNTQDITKQYIDNLQNRIQSLEERLAKLESKQGLVYEPIPYWLNPNFKMPVSS